MDKPPKKRSVVPVLLFATLVCSIAILPKIMGGGVQSAPILFLGIIIGVVASFLLLGWIWRNRFAIIARGGPILLFCGIIAVSICCIASFLPGIISGGFIAVTGAILSLRK